MLAADDGWPNVLETCKGHGNKMLLDQDKKGVSKAKKKVYFCGNCCNFCVEVKVCKNM
jgi:hypothetical protein